MDKVFFSCEYVCRLLHLAVCESERISLLCVEISDKQRATNEINRFGVCVCAVALWMVDMPTAQVKIIKIIWINHKR